MSRVFSFSALQGGFVPSHDDFADVVAMLREEIPQLPQVVGAVLFGSTLSSSYSVLSDVDVFIVFEEDGLCPSEDTLAGMDRLSFEADQHNVPVEWVCCTTQQLDQPRHALRAGLLDHIMWAAQIGGVIMRHPCPTIGYHGERRIEAHEYVLRAHDKLARTGAKWSRLSEGERCLARGKALDQPIHAARRVLEMTNPPACGWSGQRVVEATKDPILEKIAGLKFAYGERVVVDQFENPDQISYRNFLQAMDEKLFPLARRFLGHLLETQFTNPRYRSH